MISPLFYGRLMYFWRMKTTLIWATAFGVTGIAFGALGAHALKAYLTANQLASFETGVRYQIYHALFLVALAAIQHTGAIAKTSMVRNLIVVGTFLFSFSIYALALQIVLGANLRFLGPVTPIGGIVLMLGWLLLLIKAVRKQKTV
jgi:uncharacterized membrane protein YgdD (TMEM256/DUF423 family)